MEKQIKYIEYAKEFEYTPEWYAKIYHQDVIEDMKIDPGPGIHEARDTECILAMKIKDGDSVLIPGCGGGHNISLLQKMYKGLAITGVDWSETVLHFSRKVFPNVVFIQSNIDNLSLPNGSFDHVLAFDFTEHLSLAYYVSFLSKSHAVLHSSGTIGILPGLTVRPEHINLMYPPTIAQHMEQYGFEITTIGPQWIVGKKP